MDYILKDNMNALRCEACNGSLSIRQGSARGAKLVCDGMSESDMRVFVYEGVLHVKCLSDEEARIELQLPIEVTRLCVTGRKTDCIISGITAENLTLSTTGNIVLDGVKVRRGMSLSADVGKTLLRCCDIQSMTLNAAGSAVEFQGTVLHGNNLVYLIDSSLSGVLKGALPDYIIAAGNGISEESVIVNDHLLSEFPTRKVEHHSAWLYISGRMKDICRLYVKQPKENRL